MSNEAGRVYERLELWRKGKVKQLWTETVKLTMEQPQKKRGRIQQGRQQVEQQEKQTKQEEYNKVSLAGEGQFTWTVQALISLGMAEVCQAT